MDDKASISTATGRTAVAPTGGVLSKDELSQAELDLASGGRHKVEKAGGEGRGCSEVAVLAARTDETVALPLLSDERGLDVSAPAAGSERESPP